MNKYHKQTLEQKKYTYTYTHTQCYYSIDLKLRNRQNKTMLVKVRSVATFEKEE
jgi:hypothetical protein